MSAYRCPVCGYVYDETLGDPDNGIAPGTPFDHLPHDYCCETCETPMDEFRAITMPKDQLTTA